MRVSEQPRREAGSDKVVDRMRAMCHRIHPTEIIAVPEA